VVAKFQLHTFSYHTQIIAAATNFFFHTDNAQTPIFTSSERVCMLRRGKPFWFRSYTRAIVAFPEKYEYPRSSEASERSW